MRYFFTALLAALLASPALAEPAIYYWGPDGKIEGSRNAPKVRSRPVSGYKPVGVCEGMIAQVEREKGIPTQLLATIAQAESGRYDKNLKRAVAWPWTVMAEGKGRYFQTKAEAVSAVREIQGRGVRNIDIGCMQVNLRAHPNAFASLDEAFNPHDNIAYAGDLLLSLREQTGSWVKAVGNYHSATPFFHNRYRNKVLSMWRKNRLGQSGVQITTSEGSPTTAASTSGDTGFTYASYSPPEEKQQTSSVVSKQSAAPQRPNRLRLASASLAMGGESNVVRGPYSSARQGTRWQSPSVQARAERMAQNRRRSGLDVASYMIEVENTEQ
jgi:hypothetical protein